MARTIWTGSLSFGLVNIPIGLYTATSERTVHFNQFEEGTTDRIRYKRVNERTGEEVPTAQIVKGVDLGAGSFVLLSDEELESLEPQRSKTIEISDFIEQADIDPIYYRTTYYLAPQGEAAVKTYVLLRQAMLEASRIAIASFVMRGKEYLAAIRPEADVLALETLYFADEVRDPRTELPNLESDATFSDREVGAARLLIDAMASEWEPERYRDTHRERVEELVEAKRKGETVEVADEAPEPAQVIDLMEALKASVERAQAATAQPTPAPSRAPRRATNAESATKSAAAPRGKSRTGTGQRAKKAPATKTAAKKASPAARQRKAS
jgi:DNA end-binding protein Ku